MSFRLRLALFFVLIVVVPIVVVAALVVGISNTSRSAKADARLGGAMQTALAIYRRDLGRSTRAARATAADPRVQAAIAQGDPGAIQSAVSSAASAHGATAVTLRRPSGAAIGQDLADAIAVARVGLTTAGGARAGSLAAATTAVAAFTRQVHRLTGLDAVVLGGRGVLGGTESVDAGGLPAPGSSGDVTAGGNEVRATTARLPGAGGRLDVSLLGPIPSAGFLSSRPGVAIVVAAFLALALALIVLLLRSLGGQVAQMLAAARRIGGGDFKGEVPVQGNDELAGLAREFNRMSARLSAQVDELRRQRDEIERSVQRIGEAFASGLDRQALLAIVVETALGPATPPTA